MLAFSTDDVREVLTFWNEHPACMIMSNSEMYVVGLDLETSEHWYITCPEELEEIIAQQ